MIFIIINLLFVFWESSIYLFFIAEMRTKIWDRVQDGVQVTKHFKLFYKEFENIDHCNIT